MLSERAASALDAAARRSVAAASSIPDKKPAVTPTARERRGRSKSPNRKLVLHPRLYAKHKAEQPEQPERVQSKELLEARVKSDALWATVNAKRQVSWRQLHQESSEGSDADESEGAASVSHNPIRSPELLCEVLSSEQIQSTLSESTKTLIRAGLSQRLVKKQLERSVSERVL